MICTLCLIPNNMQLGAELADYRKKLYETRWPLEGRGALRWQNQRGLFFKLFSQSFNFFFCGKTDWHWHTQKHAVRRRKKPQKQMTTAEEEQKRRKAPPFQIWIFWYLTVHLMFSSTDSSNIQRYFLSHWSARHNDNSKSLQTHRHAVARSASHTPQHLSLVSTQKSALSKLIPGHTTVLL